MTESGNVRAMRAKLAEQLQPIPADFLASLSSNEMRMANHWKLYVNGELIDPATVASAELVWKDFVIRFGMTPLGYPSCAFRETHGGCVVVVPFVLINTVYGNELFVGLIEQKRYNMGGNAVLTCPAGFAIAEVSKAQAAAIEANEESGGQIKPTSNMRFFELLQPGNSNRAFFLTERDEGVSYFGLRLLPSEVRETTAEKDLFHRVYELTEQTDRIATKTFATAEQSEQIVSKVRFRHWTVAAAAPDIIGANGAVSRLMAYLWHNEEFFV